MTRTRVRPDGIVTTATDRILGRASAGAGPVEEITCTAAGRALIDDVDAAAQRATLGLGNISLQNANAVAITGGSITGITDLAVADGGTGASAAPDARANLGVAIGTDVQAQNANLQALANQTTAADRLSYWTGSGTAALATLTSLARSLLDDTSTTAMRATIGCPQGSASALLLNDGTTSTYLESTGGGTLSINDQTKYSTASATQRPESMYMRLRAWANFDGVANDNITGTYSQSGTTVTVTITSPAAWNYNSWDGVMAGHQIFADATSGTAVDGLYTVTATRYEDNALDFNQFRYTAGTSLTTSGNITIRRCTIRQSNGISSVTDNGVGDYIVNLQQEFADANYSVQLNGQRGDNSTFGFLQLRATANNTMNQTQTSFRILSATSAGGALDYPLVNVAVFR